MRELRLILPNEPLHICPALRSDAVACASLVSPRTHPRNLSVSLFSNRRASSGPRDSLAAYDRFEDFASDIRRVFSKAISYHGAEVCSDVPEDAGAGSSDGAAPQVRQGHAHLEEFFIHALGMHPGGRDC